jgi:hypothetical protein
MYMSGRHAESSQYGDPRSPYYRDPKRRQTRNRLLATGATVAIGVVAILGLKSIWGKDWTPEDPLPPNVGETAASAPPNAPESNPNLSEFIADTKAIAQAIFANAQDTDSRSVAYGGNSFGNEVAYERDNLVNTTIPEMLINYNPDNRLMTVQSTDWYLPEDGGSQREYSQVALEFNVGIEPNALDQELRAGGQLEIDDFAAMLAYDSVVPQYAEAGRLYPPGVSWAEINTGNTYMFADQLGPDQPPVVSTEATAVQLETLVTDMQSVQADHRAALN